MQIDGIEYRHVDQTGLHLIEELRARFIPFNQALGKDFPEEYDEAAMNRNLKHFLAQAAGGAMRIFLARDVHTDRYVGFCLTTLDRAGEGSIDSFLVADEYRGKGIGVRLFQQALDWLDAEGAADVKLNVLPGNEKAIRFYHRFGFRPLNITMKRVRSRKTDTQSG